MTRASLRNGLLAALLLPLMAAAQNLVPVDEAGYQKLIQSQKGSVVLVDFWATYCKPCRAELPQLVKLTEKLKAKGLKLVTVSADEPEAEATAKKFLTDTGAASLPAYIRRAKDDDKFADAIDPKWQGVLPALFIYDRTGKKARSFVGESPISDIEAAIQKLL
jgi:thiol-disulfide isomerase/thioredoxin